MNICVYFLIKVVTNIQFMSEKNKILALAHKKNGLVTAKDAALLGIPGRALFDCVKDGMLLRDERGVYIVPDQFSDEFFIAQYKYSKGVFAFNTALYLWGLSDRTPLQLEMTFPKGYNVTAAKKFGIACKILVQNKYDLEITTAKTPAGNKVRIYGIERTLCDMIKYKADPELFLNAIKAYVARVDKNLNKLFLIASTLGVQDKIRPYVEALL